MAPPANRPVNPLITAAGPQPEQSGEQVSALGKLGFGLAAFGASGFIPYKGNRLWDTYLKGIRAVETGFPGAILRTFRVSEFLSPFESWNRLHVPQEILATSGKYGDYLRTIYGTGIDEITLQRSGAMFGEVTTKGGKAVGLGLQITAGTQKGASVADYFARLSGIELGPQQSLNDALLRSQWAAQGSPLKYKEWLEALAPHARREKLVLGARYREKLRILGKDYALSDRMKRVVAKGEITGKLLRAKAATTAGRLNVLLSKPLEFLPESWQRSPIIRSIAVEPGTTTQMFGRFVKKALVVGAAWKGLEYYDYVRSEGGVWSTALGAGAGAAVGGLLFKKPGMRLSRGGLMAGAAVGLYTALSPRFDYGLFHGAASIFTDINLARAEASEAIGLTESLQQQERVAPGLVSLKTALGFGGIGALGLGMYEYGAFLAAAGKEKYKAGGMLADIFENLRDVRKERIGERFWGTRAGKGIAKLPGGRFLAKAKGPMAFGFLAGLAAWGAASTTLSLLSGNVMAATPGLNLLGTTETPEELAAIYSGEQEVPVRKGRWWEFGRSSGYEGSRIEYYRPHFLHRLKTRAFQKGVYGTEEERWAHDPWANPLKALVGSDEWKYYYERKYQYERPAPLTSTYGEDIPFIGPAVAATVGKLLKPRKLVRPEEWNLGGGEYLHVPDVRGETEPAYELGGLGPGAPVMPEDTSQLFNELMYRRREAVGLIGFAEGAIQKAVTGREEFFQNLQTLGTMGREMGSEYWLWSHLNLGGGALTTEPIRRFIPHTRSYLETYNPLRNLMPSWIPEDYFLDLKRGDPFQKVKEAEIRLPGPGYTALHPELEGVHPERYPLAHRLKILGDVAMWSDEYRQTLAKAKRNFNRLSDQEKIMVRTTEEQVKAKKVRREFQEYRFDEDKLVSQDLTVTDVLTPRRVRTAEYGDMVVELQGTGAVTNMADAMTFAVDTLKDRKVKMYMPAAPSRRFDTIKAGGRMKAVAMIGDLDYGKAMAEEGLAQTRELTDEFEQLRYTGAERLAGRLSEQLLHGIETPIEYLTPMSPTAKLIRRRSAIEEYVASEAVGCLLPNQYVRTKEAIKYIKDIRVNNLVYTDSGNWRRVVAVTSKRMPHDDVIKIIVAGMFPFPIQVTPDHQILCWSNLDRPMYLPAEAINTSHELVYPIPDLVTERNTRQISVSKTVARDDLIFKDGFVKIGSRRGGKLVGCNRGRFVQDKIELTDEFYELIGYYLAEGCATKKNKADIPTCTSFAFHTKEEEYYGFVKEALRNIFSLPCRFDIKGNSCEVLCNSVLLSQFFKALCGRVAEEKFISELLVPATRDNIIALLRGYIRGDGHYDFNKKSISCVSTSHRLIVSIRDLLLSIGIVASVGYLEAGSYLCQGKTINQKESFTLNITGQGSRKLLELIDPQYAFESIKGHRTNHLRIKNGYLLSKVEKVELAEWDNLVYDLTVEGDCSFSGSTGYIYHNSGNAFWDRPVENFLKPAADMALHSIGFSGIPEQIRQRRDINEYFDMLEWTKSEMMEQRARQEGRWQDVKEQQQIQQETMFGVDVFGSPVNVMKALPRRERDFYASFVEAQTQDEREQILKLIPPNERRVYLAQWLRQEEGAARAKQEAKIAQDFDDRTLAAASIARKAEGYPISPELEEQWMEETGGKIPYDEWIRLKKAEEYFSTHSLPGADWLGWHPSTDLDDVKLKYVEMAGLDHHDFDLWGARRRALARKPYINEAVISQLQNAENFDELVKTRLNAKAIAKMHGDSDARVHIRHISANIKEGYDFEIVDGREELVRDTYKYMGIK